MDDRTFQDVSLVIWARENRRRGKKQSMSTHWLYRVSVIPQTPLKVPGWKFSKRGAYS